MTSWPPEPNSAASSSLNPIHLHEAWEEATYEYPDVKYSPEIIARVYFMNYAAGYVHPDEEAGVALKRWLAKP